MIIKGKRALNKAIELKDFFHFYNWATYSQLDTINPAARRSSIPSLYHQPQREWQHSYANSIIQEAGRSLIIEADGLPIGQINYHEISRVCNAAHIDIFIAEEVNGGRELEPETIKTLAAYLFNHMDIEKCEIEIIADNLEAIEAYKKIGFTTAHAYANEGVLWQKMELHKNQLQHCAQKEFQAAS
jgi:RimJ/RimL family protein N-acetyltransferase